MEDAADFEGIVDVDEEEAVVGDAEAEFVAALKRLHIALARHSEAMQGVQNTHGGGLIETANIGLGRVCPDDPLQIGPLKLSISSWVMPSSASTRSWGMP